MSPLAERVATRYAQRVAGGGLAKLAGRQLDELGRGLADLEALSLNLTDMEQTFDVHFLGARIQ
jgi:hypothetical protein